jgi:hypothetical protein
MFAMAAPYAKAQYSINPRLCNEGNVSISFVGAYRQNGFFSDKWRVMGWMEVKPHECRQIGRADIKKSWGQYQPALYVSIMYQDSYGKQKLARFDNAPDGWIKSDRPMCITDPDAFDFETSDHDDGPDRQCATGYTQISATFVTSGHEVYDPNNSPDDRYYAAATDLHLDIQPDDVATNSPAGTSESKSNERSSGGSDQNSGPSLWAMFTQAIKEHNQENDARFYNLVKETLLGSGAPPLHRKTCQRGIETECNMIEFCMNRSFVDTVSRYQSNADLVRTDLRSYFASREMNGSDRGRVEILLGFKDGALTGGEAIPSDICPTDADSVKLQVHWASRQ